MTRVNTQSRFIEMFHNTKTTSIGAIFETTSGGTPSSKVTEYYEGGTIPWLTSSEVGQGMINTTNGFITELGLKNSSAKWVPANTVVVAMYGATVGKVGLLQMPSTTNQAVCCILPKTGVNSLFLYYAIKNKEAWMISQAVGAAQPNISQTVIKKMEIPLPNLPEQNAFVAFAQQADKSKFNGFKSRFIARFINQSYDKKRLGDVSSVFSGKTIDLALENEGGPVAYLKVADLNLVENDRVVTTSSRFVSEQTAKTSGLVPIGATIFPKNGAAALHNKKRITSIITCVDMNTMAVYSTSENVKPEYLYAFLESQDLAALTLVGAIPQIRAKDVQALLIPMPTVEEQERYIAMMHQADKSKYLS